MRDPRARPFVSCAMQALWAIPCPLAASHHAAGPPDWAYNRLLSPPLYLGLLATAAATQDGAAAASVVRVVALIAIIIPVIVVVAVVVVVDVPAAAAFAGGHG